MSDEKTQNVELNAGELVFFTEGEYSDYHFTGSFVALQNVSNEEMLALAEEVRTTQHGYDVRPAFLAAAIARGWLLTINAREIHIGSYGELDLS